MYRGLRELLSKEVLTLQTAGEGLIGEVAVAGEVKEEVKTEMKRKRRKEKTKELVVILEEEAGGEEEGSLDGIALDM